MTLNHLEGHLAVPRLTNGIHLQHFAKFQLTKHAMWSLDDSWASCFYPLQSNTPRSEPNALLTMTCNRRHLLTVSDVYNIQLAYPTNCWFNQQLDIQCFPNMFLCCTNLGHHLQKQYYNHSTELIKWQNLLQRTCYGMCYISWWVTFHQQVNHKISVMYKTANQTPPPVKLMTKGGVYLPQASV